jgi:hypothetical protein
MEYGRQYRNGTQGIYGYDFGLNGIKFCPVIPKSYDGVKTLMGFKYRGATLNIKVTGFGQNIRSFKINGNKMTNAYMEATATGTQNIEIEMDNIAFDQQAFQSYSQNHFTLPNPVIARNDNEIIMGRNTKCIHIQNIQKRTKMDNVGETYYNSKHQ